MQDKEFLAQFENCTLPKTEFRHRNHLRLAWLFLTQQPLDQALEHITSSILRYATHLGASGIYHQTLTEFWVRLVYQNLRGENSSFDTFMTKHAFLLDKNLPYQYYSSTLLDSDAARKKWFEPDLKSLDA